MEKKEILKILRAQINVNGHIVGAVAGPANTPIDMQYLYQNTECHGYVGVYADNGITGTKAEAREEFNRMIADCEVGKIDIILTKSISRFAHNTFDLLNTVRRLKELGVSAQFKKENI